MGVFSFIFNIIFLDSGAGVYEFFDSGLREINKYLFLVIDFSKSIAIFLVFLVIVKYFSDQIEKNEGLVSPQFIKSILIYPVLIMLYAELLWLIYFLQEYFIYLILPSERGNRGLTGSAEVIKLFNNLWSTLMGVELSDVNILNLGFNVLAQWLGWVFAIVLFAIFFVLLIVPYFFKFVLLLIDEIFLKIFGSLSIALSVSETYKNSFPNWLQKYGHLIISRIALSIVLVLNLAILKSVTNQMFSKKGFLFTDLFIDTSGGSNQINSLNELKNLSNLDITSLIVTLLVYIIIQFLFSALVMIANIHEKIASFVIVGSGGSISSGVTPGSFLGGASSLATAGTALLLKGFSKAMNSSRGSLGSSGGGGSGSGESLGERVRQMKQPSEKIKT